MIPNLKYFFGKMTMYPSFDREARDMILYFLKRHFGDRDGLITVADPVLLERPQEKLRELFVEDDFRADYKILNRAVRQRGFNIPPLVSAYMSLSPTMRVFGTAVNDTFGNVEETGILIAVDEILEEKRKRHIESFVDPNSLTQLPELYSRPCVVEDNSSISLYNPDAPLWSIGIFASSQRSFAFVRRPVALKTALYRRR